MKFRKLALAIALGTSIPTAALATPLQCFNLTKFVNYNCYIPFQTCNVVAFLEDPCGIIDIQNEASAIQRYVRIATEIQQAAQNISQLKDQILQYTSMFQYIGNDIKNIKSQFTLYQMLNGLPIIQSSSGMTSQQMYNHYQNIYGQYISSQPITPAQEATRAQAIQNDVQSEATYALSYATNIRKTMEDNVNTDLQKMVTAIGTTKTEQEDLTENNKIKEKVLQLVMQRNVLLTEILKLRAKAIMLKDSSSMGHIVASPVN